jgi:hypothetical protein
VDVTWLNPNGNGGLCDIEIAVKVDFTFKQITGPGQWGKTLTLTSPVEWLQETNHPFIRRANSNLMAQFYMSPGSQGTFIPAARDLAGDTVLGRGCSKNERVTHSFILAPRSVPGAWGTNPLVKQFPARRG